MGDFDSDYRYLGSKTEVLKKNANFFAKKCLKSPKIVFITSTPGVSLHSGSECSRTPGFSS
jgi:hypothetical protein